MNLALRPRLIELLIADDAAAWRGLGFRVDDDDNLDLGGVRLRFLADGDERDGRAGVVGWSFTGLEVEGEIDGLPTPTPSLRLPPPFQTHPNGVTGLDQLVVFTGDFKRTTAALAASQIELKRKTETAYGQTGFSRIGPAILELVERPAAEEGQARFWGLAVVVISLEELAERLGDKLGPIRPALQPGRRIAVLDGAAAGIKTTLAFLSPEPR